MYVITMATASGALQETSQILNKYFRCICAVAVGEIVRASLGRLPISLFKIYENVDASEQPCKQAMLFVDNAGGLRRE